MCGPTIRACPVRVTPTTRRWPSASSSSIFQPAHSAGRTRVIRAISALGSRQSEAIWSGIRTRITWSVVHLTVATVGMPSRW